MTRNGHDTYTGGDRAALRGAEANASQIPRAMSSAPRSLSAGTAVREGDTIVVTKLDRLARSVRDARDIADELTTKGVALSLSGSRYDPTDPVGRLLFNVLAMVAEGKQPKLSTTQHKLLFDVQDRGKYSQTEIAESFSVSRATVYRELHRRRTAFLDTCEAHIF